MDFVREKAGRRTNQTIHQTKPFILISLTFNLRYFVLADTC